MMITRIFRMKKYSGLAQNSLMSSTSFLLQRYRQCFMTTSANSTTSNKESDGARKPIDSTIDQETTDENLKQQQEEPSNDNKKKNNNTTTETTTEEKKTNQQESVGVAVDPEQLVEQIQQKEQEIARLREVSLRAYAEMENVRKIAQRDVENARKYSIGAFAKDLLEVADNLERALQNIPSEKLDPEKGDAIVIGLYEGVKATVSRSIVLVHIVDRMVGRMMYYIKYFRGMVLKSMIRWERSLIPIFIKQCFKFLMSRIAVA